MADRIDPQDVLRLLGIDIPAQAYSTGKFDIQCPFCDDQKRHMNINLAKGQFHCRRCAEGGSVVQLYGRLQSPPITDYKEVRVQIGNELNGGTTRFEYMKKRKPVVTNPAEKLAPVDKRDKAYRALLSLCALKKEHMVDLMRRGLAFSYIKENGYKSTPNRDAVAKIGRKVLEVSGLTDLGGVPGFFLDSKDKWQLKQMVSGYFIPYLTSGGKIQGLQIRTDEAVRKEFTKSKGTELGKYIWLTSAKVPKGCSRGTTVEGFIHIRNITGTMILTEGGLKADIASCLMDNKFGLIAIPGVNMVKALPNVLKECKDKGTKKVVVALDMDMHRNKFVLNACRKINQTVESAGLDLSMLQWEQEKGIDDFLLAQTKDDELLIKEVDAFI